MLPIIPSDSWKPSGAANPMLRILALLTVSLGLPYFVLSSTGPLMQQWFSQTHPGRSPYRLFALSNTGSLLALVSYPFLFEPTLTRTVQARAWGWGLAVFAVCCGFCALKLFNANDGINVMTPAEAPRGDAASVLTSGSSRLPRLTPLLWLALPACASVLLLATTNKLCQDVAVIPFLWVLPLGLYLLSFIISFDNPRWYARLPFAIALVVMLGALCWALPHSRETSLFLLLPLYGGGLFVCCMVCHGELYRLKPDPARLTLFYLMIAAGGALGGAFVAILAPLIFNDYYELHLGLFLCGLLFLLSCVFQKGQAGTSAMSWSSLPVAAGPLGLLALAAALWFQAHHGLSTAISQSRNFYGVLTVHEYDKDDPQAHQFQLLHGATLHGIQFADPLLSLRRTAYYTERSGAGLALRSFPAGHRRIGLVGLGVGTLASYAEPGDYVRIYEINPEVQRLASSKFTYLSDCL